MKGNPYNPLPFNPHAAQYNLPVIGPHPFPRRRKKRAPWWAWLLFWIVLSPLICFVLYWGTIWIIFVIFMAAAGWILDNGKKPSRKKR